MVSCLRLDGLIDHFKVAYKQYIYSSLVLNLCLIDLPGQTKVPVGDQPDNIEQVVML